jgi:WD40 repeat protein
MITQTLSFSFTKEQNVNESLLFYNGSESTTITIKQIIKVKDLIIALNSSNIIAIYTKNIDNKFILQHLVKIPFNKMFDDSIITKNSDEEILNVAVNLIGNLLVCLTNKNRIFKLKIMSTDLESVRYIELEPPPVLALHYSSIVSLSCSSVQKALIVTADCENSLKIWNYTKGCLVMCKEFYESITCIAIHPNGLYLAVSFLNKIIYYSIGLNDFQALFIFQTKSCKYCSFSRNGHRFGFIDSKIIKIYNLLNFEIIIEFKMPTGRVQHFEWLDYDELMVSCSNAGLICVWNILSGEIIYEYIDKSVHFKQVQISYKHRHHQQQQQLKNDQILKIYAQDDNNNIHLLTKKITINCLNCNSTITSNRITLVENLILQEVTSRITIEGNENILLYSLLNDTDDMIVYTTDKSQIFINFSINKKKQINLNYTKSTKISHVKLISNKLDDKIHLIVCTDEGFVTFYSLDNLNRYFDMNERKGDSLSLLKWSNNILVNKGDVFKISKREESLAKQIIDKEDQELLTIERVELKHRNQIRIIIVQSKTQLSRLNDFLLQLKDKSLEKEANHKSKLQNLRIQFEKDYENFKVRAENELSHKIATNKHLKEQLQSCN